MTAARTAAVTALAVASFGLTACGGTVSGTALPGSGGVVTPSAATAETTPVPLTLAQLVADTTSRAAYFWQSEGVSGVDVKAVPISSGPLTCADEVAPTSSALYCPAAGPFDRIKYLSDRLEQRRAGGGDLAVQVTIAHEVAHAAQRKTGRTVNTYPSRAAGELSADCGAGAYMSAAHADPAAVRAALPATALGKDNESVGLFSADRLVAFDAGFSGKVSAIGCLDYRR